MFIFDTLMEFVTRQVLLGLFGTRLGRAQLSLHSRSGFKKTPGKKGIDYYNVLPSRKLGW